MKSTLALLAALALALLSPRAHATSIPFTDVVLTGTLTVEPSTAGGDPTKVNLTKKQLLTYFGFPSVNPASIVFTFESDTPNYITIGIANKHDLGGYGGLVTYNTGQQYTIPSADGRTYTQYGSANLLNEQFTGTIVLTGRIVRGKKQTAQTISFSFAGSGSTTGQSTPNAILKGTFRGTYNTPTAP